MLTYGYGYIRVSIKPEFVKVVYLATPAINYRCYGKLGAPRSRNRSCRVLLEFVFLILFLTECSLFNLVT